MHSSTKYNQILDALQTLLINKNIQNISVSEIAQVAGIGKGSVYYYFPSKDSILEALIERSYKKPMEIASHLAEQKDVSPFTRMALIFQACQASSDEIGCHNRQSSQIDAKEQAFLHQKYLTHLITGLKPALAEIIRQGIECGDIHFEYPKALAEIVLIVLTVKLDNTISPSSPEEIEETILALISLLEKGTDNPSGSLNFLKI